MNPVLKEVYKLHPQSTIGGALMLALRGRLERIKGVPNRIGGDFEHEKSLLIFGKGGTGKTKTLKKVFKGLGLDGLNDAGEIVAKYHESAGCSTVVGIASMLEEWGNVIHFFDEMSFNSTGHIHLMKQIANGVISRQRHQNTQPFPFDGLIVGATNGIKPPKPAEMEDFLATLDRFWIVEARPVELGPAEYFDAVLNYRRQKETESPDWDVISEALDNECYADLTAKELKYAENLWQEKSREILDGGERAQFRNVTSVIDIVTFVKRITGTKDLTTNEELKSFCRAMIRDMIVFNPAPLFALSSAQRAVYNIVLKREGNATLQDIASGCKTVHGGGNVHRVINQLMNLGLIYRTAHGRYSNRVSEAEARVKKSAATTSKKKGAAKKRKLVNSL